MAHTVTPRRGKARTGYKNPQNGYVEAFSGAWLACLLFGPFYFLVKGVWAHAFLAAVLAFITGGLSWLVYPVFARQILETNYARRGWERIEL